MAWKFGADDFKSATLAFIALGNHFERAIALDIAAFGIASPFDFFTAVGPLVDFAEVRCVIPKSFEVNMRS